MADDQTSSYNVWAYVHYKPLEDLIITLLPFI